MSLFGITGCVINLIISSICIFVHERRSGRSWLIYAAVLHLIYAMTYGFMIPHLGDETLTAVLGDWSGTPITIGLTVACVVLPATFLALFGKRLDPRLVAASATGAAIMALAIALLFGPFGAYFVGHSLNALLMILVGAALLARRDAFYRLAGASFIGRGGYSVLLVAMAASGWHVQTYQSALTINLIFISISGFAVILIELDYVRARAMDADIAKTRFVANMSHELRTPLNAIIGFSEVLRMEEMALPRETEKDYARSIHEAGRHLLGIVDQILKIASVEASQAGATAGSEFRLDEVMAACVHLSSGAARAKGVAVETASPSGGILVHSDECAVRGILTAIIENAIRHSPTGSKVSVAVSEDRAAGMATAVVSDAGPGIEEKFQEKIFDLFWQVEGPYQRSHGGMGVGLTLARRNARRLGGDVTVASAPGRGSAFTVTLPIRPPESRPKRSSSSVATLAGPRRAADIRAPEP